MFGDLLGAVVSWPTLLLVLLVWGFAPRLVLRFVVHAFRKDDPRRKELLGELGAVPRLERPIWVAEQVEVALVEGIGERIIWAATGRVIHRWRLGDGVDRHERHPDTFEIPSDDDKAAIEPGMIVKLMFEMRDGWGERMWVRVKRLKGKRLVGELVNDPVGIPRLLYGDEITFTRDHVIDIDIVDAPVSAADQD